MTGMRTICGRHSRRVSTRRTASGMTLLEMLVVFVLASLAGTLLVQGAGFFLGQYDNVKRISGEASSGALQQRWFASTVHAMAPFLASDRRFAGDHTFFQGITTQALRAPSGVPVAARWSIVSGESGTAVVYSEQASPCPPAAGATNVSATQSPRSRETDGRETDSHAANPAQGLGDFACGAGSLEAIHWTVFESDEPLVFVYAGTDGAWRTNWPVEGLQEWVPREVRLVTTTAHTVWVANFALYHVPVVNPRDFR